MILKPGTRLKSVVCSTQVIVVRASDADLTLCCGGAPMAALDADGTGSDAPVDPKGPTQLGKRYELDRLGVELLCTMGGDGALTIDGEPLQVKAAKALPSSD